MEGKPRGLPREGRRAFKPQTALLRRRPTVGVETWIPPEREKWSYTPGDSIYRIGRREGVPRSAAPRMGLWQARRRSWDITPKGVVLGEPWFVLGEWGRRDRFGARRGESLFSPNVMALLKRKYRRAVQGEWQNQLNAWEHQHPEEEGVEDLKVFRRFTSSFFPAAHFTGLGK